MNKRFGLLALITVLFSSVTVVNAAGFSFLDMKQQCDNDPASISCKNMQKEAAERCKAIPDSFVCHRMRVVQMSRCMGNPRLSYCDKYQSEISNVCKDHPDETGCAHSRIRQACDNNPKSKNCIKAKKEAKVAYCKANPDSIPCL